MDKETARRIFRCAAQALGRELQEFGEGVGERTIMCRLAHHLATRIEAHDGSLRVDCEYNRHGNTIKKLPTRIFPDIIVHQRRNDDHNLLICGIKKPNGEQRFGEDRKRLEQFASKCGEYHYDIGVFLIVKQSKPDISKPRITAEYFEDGKRVLEGEEIERIC